MDFKERYDYSCSAVGWASRNGDVELLRRYLQEGKDYCVKDNRGWFPIHEAAFYGHTECVEELLKVACCNEENPLEIWPSPYDLNDRNALVLAARNGHFNTVKVLADVYSHDSEDFQCAVEASLNCSEIFLYLLSKYTGDINCSNKWDQTLLHVAVLSASLDTIKILFRFNIDIEAKDIHGRSALHCVCGENTKSNSLEIVKILVNRGCDVNSCDQDGCTALFVAAQNNLLPIVEYLVQSGADPYQGFSIKDVSSFAGLNAVTIAAPICIAAEKGFVSILKYFLTIMNQNTLFEKNIWSPVFSAISGLQLNCLKVLLEQGYNLCFKHSTNNLKCDDTCVMVLELVDLELFSSLNSQDQNRTIELLTYLLKHGANIKPLVEFMLDVRFIFGNCEVLLMLFIKYGAYEYLISTSMFQSPLDYLKFVFAHKFNNHTNLSILLDHMPVVESTYCSQSGTFSICEGRIPSLLCLCRFAIRAILMSRYGNLKFVNDLPLPKFLIEYLMLNKYV